MGLTGRGALGQVAKNCIKITKLAFMGQNSGGGTWGGQAPPPPVPPSLPLGKTLPKSQNFPLGVNHGHDTDFSKLVNLCPIKTFSLISTPESPFSIPNQTSKFNRQSLIVIG